MNYNSGSVLVSAEELAVQENYMKAVADLSLGKKLRVCVRTFGCQQNEADSERLVGMAIRMGYTPTDDFSEADLILFNTCAVREHAELKTLSITGQCKKLKEENPSLRIGICGCMVSQPHREDAIKKSYPYVDFLFGTGQIHRFPEMLYRSLTEHGRLFFQNDGTNRIAEGLPVCRASNFQAWVSVMYGCNNFCSYCIVPYVRGRERSRRTDHVIHEVEVLAAAGYREITLLGQNVNSYAGENEDGSVCDFAALLRRICAIPGDFKVRFMTSHPKDVSPALIETIAEEPKIACHFHLPLQAGSDRILKLMNRRYTLESYRRTVEALRSAVPEIGLTTDLIVGFPSETAAEFEETLSAVREFQYDSVYSFIYSPRRGTRAAEMADQIPEDIKSFRCKTLVDLQSEISRKKNEAFVGQTVNVLVEGPSKTDKSKLTGRTEQNRLVHFLAPVSTIGTWQSVHITDAEAYALYGEIKEN